MSLLAASQFDPSGHHYASVVQALDTHKVRVQSTESSALAQAFSLDKGLRLTSLSWGVSASTSAKHEGNFGIENQVVNVGVNKGSILVYNPLANQVLATLENPNAVSISDYHFSELTNSGWSVDINRNVIEWDLILFKPKQQLKFNDDITVVRVVLHEGKPHLLLASHSIQLYDLAKKEIVKTYPGHISPIHTVIPFSNDKTSSTATHFITAATGDRFINIYSLSESTTHVLVSQSNVSSVSNSGLNISAVTEDGIVEVFTDILTKPVVTGRRKGQQSKQSQHKITLQRQETSQCIKIDQSVLSSEGSLKFSWLENADIPYFHTVEISSLSNEQITVSKTKPALQAKDHTLYGTDVAAPRHYNEGQTHITSGDNFRHLNNVASQLDEELEYDENDGPSLSEKLELLKVEATKPKKKLSATTSAAAVATHATTGSLAVILTQSLRSNDHSLLETVLSTRDETVIRTTVSRLDTTLAVILLERLAERIARQTNRQAQLNVWVRWVLVIHGSYLVNLPNLKGGLSSLHSTLVKRANTLGRLNELKGKLEVYYDIRDLNGDDDDNVEESEEEGEEDEDVEYIEELDDAGLIDDGEEDYEMDEDEEMEEEDGYIRTNVGSDSEEEQDEKIEKFESDAEYDQEEGYSDEEVGTKRAAEEDEDDQQALMKKIKALKARQDKKRNGRK